ncbi:MAG: hypothetical protein KKA12_08545 [Alphaproteobacteria bacterium]|nr:hypothetical protein [Alphaproteobacteria bacterium]
MRKDKGKPPSDRAIELLIGKLEKLRASGHDPGNVLDQSTLQNWTDLYPVKEPDNGNQRHRNQRSDSDEPRDPFVRAAIERKAERAALERG